MSAAVVEFANLALRQSAEGPAEIAVADAPPSCGGGNAYNGQMGLRISSVFIILIGSTFGKLFIGFSVDFSGGVELTRISFQVLFSQ